MIRRVKAEKEIIIRIVCDDNLSLFDENGCENVVKLFVFSELFLVRFEARPKLPIIVLLCRYHHYFSAISYDAIYFFNEVSFFFVKSGEKSAAFFSLSHFHRMSLTRERLRGERKHSIYILFLCVQSMPNPKS